MLDGQRCRRRQNFLRKKASQKAPSGFKLAFQSLSDWTLFCKPELIFYFFKSLTALKSPPRSFCSLRFHFPTLHKPQLSDWRITAGLLFPSRKAFELSWIQTRIRKIPRSGTERKHGATPESLRTDLGCNHSWKMSCFLSKCFHKRSKTARSQWATNQCFKIIQTWPHDWQINRNRTLKWKHIPDPRELFQIHFHFQFNLVKRKKHHYYRKKKKNHSFNLNITAGELSCQNFFFNP